MYIYICICMCISGFIDFNQGSNTFSSHIFRAFHPGHYFYWITRVRHIKMPEASNPNRIMPAGFLISAGITNGSTSRYGRASRRLTRDTADETTTSAVRSVHGLLARMVAILAMNARGSPPGRPAAAPWFTPLPQPLLAPAVAAPKKARKSSSASTSPPPPPRKPLAPIFDLSSVPQVL